MEIKKMAKTGNRDACKVLAKQLVQVRKQKTRTYAVSSKVTSMSTQTKLMNSQMKMAGAMATTTKVRPFCLFKLVLNVHKSLSQAPWIVAKFILVNPDSDLKLNF